MIKKLTQEVMDGTKKVADEVKSGGRSAYLASLGVYATAEEETKGLFSRFVAKGEKYEETQTDYVKLATDKVRKVGQQVEDKVETTVSGTLNRFGVPSRNEISTLIQRVEQLTEKVEAINAN